MSQERTDRTAPSAERRPPHPMWLALLAGLAVLLVAFLPALWTMWRTPPAASGGAGADAADAPWGVQTPAAGVSRVFGLPLPGATLADAQARWGAELQLALMASRGQAPVLEASVERATLGGVVGRLIFSADAAPEDLRRWREASAKEVPISADTRQVTLRADDAAAALRAPLVAIGFIPAAQLDAATLRQRFGAPAEVRREGEAVEHWLYPDRGLAIVLDPKGRELLQYVAPADFERRLRAPLLSAPGAASAPAAGPPG